MALTSTLACAEDELAPTYALEGAWEGVYTIGAGPEEFYFALFFNDAGTVVVAADSPTDPGVATGTWNVVNNAVRFTYTYLVGGGTFSADMDYSAFSPEATGTWGAGSSTVDGGLFFVAKR
jgi:hypothetical protein